MDIEWAVAAKIIRFVSELPPKEQWQLGLALPTVALAIGTLIWNRGKVSGRTFEVLHGQGDLAYLLRHVCSPKAVL